jgi:hypothetical protein
VPGDATGVWVDWLRFPQLAAGSTTFKYSINIVQGAGGIVVVGSMPTTLVGNETFGLAANTFVGGHPGTAVRLVGIAGVSTSAGSAQTIYITPHKTYT